MQAPTDGSTYREHPPPAAFAGIVECLWRRERWRPPELGVGVLPDGRVDLIWAEGELLVIGPQTRALSPPLPADVVVVGARFPPGVGPSILGISAHELANRHLKLESIDTRRAAVLRQDLLEIEEAGDASARLTQALARRVDGSEPADAVVRRAAALLDRPKAQVKPIADALALSERQLERRFLETVGYGPKSLQRVLRFQRFLEALGSAPGSAEGLARIAGAVGYADQAHLTNEARELSGLTPTRLKRSLRALGAAGASGVFKTGTCRIPSRQGSPGQRGLPS